MEGLVETHKRSLAKAIVYKGGSVALLALLSWVFTKDLLSMSLITVSYEVIAIIGYYVHERIWGKVTWGKS